MKMTVDRLLRSTGLVDVLKPHLPAETGCKAFTFISRLRHIFSVTVELLTLNSIKQNTSDAYLQCNAFLALNVYEISVKIC